jgi:hypothetical protein
MDIPAAYADFVKSFGEPGINTKLYGMPFLQSRYIWFHENGIRTPEVYPGGFVPSIRGVRQTFKYGGHLFSFIAPILVHGNIFRWPRCSTVAESISPNIRV